MAFLTQDLVGTDLLTWDDNFLSGGFSLPELPPPPSFVADLALSNPQAAQTLLTTPPSSPDSGFPASPQHANASDMEAPVDIKPFIKSERSSLAFSHDNVSSHVGSTKRGMSPGGISVDTSSFEEQSAKKQRRMLKNRESACLSRKRKKEYIETLEKQVSDTVQERDALRVRVASLESENIALKSELDEYRTGRRTKTVGAAAATTCLLGFLFVFSLFSSPTTPAPMPTHTTHALAPFGRTLKSIGHVQDVGSSLAPRRVAPSPSEARVDDHEAWRQLQRAKFLDARDITTDVTLPYKQNSTMLPIFRLSDDYNADLLLSLQRRPDTSYILCSEVRVVSAATAGDHPRMSVIMPAPRVQPARKNATIFTTDAVQIDCDIVQTTPMAVNNLTSRDVRA